jgi:hypothetical protein
VAFLVLLAGEEDEGGSNDAGGGWKDDCDGEGFFSFMVLAAMR